MSEKRPTLSASCAQCDQPVTLHLSGRIGASNRPALQSGIWKCPHCQRLNDGGFIGGVTLASRHYEPVRIAYADSVSASIKARLRA